MNRKTYRGIITSLKDNQVFVFGSNSSGFHGAGSAGFASFGEMGNVWRKYGYDMWEDGTKGLWNVKGVAEGFQEGNCGKSYAIPTVVLAGMKKSIPLKEIRDSISELYIFAEQHPELEFLISYGVRRNLNGYTPQEMADLFSWGYKGEPTPPPDNIIFEEKFAELVFGRDIEVFDIGAI